jgi:hypothetical protein
MATNINFNKKLGITGGTGISLPSSTPSYQNEYSFQFDGVDDYIDCGNDSSLQITSELSISFWFKSSSTSDQAVITKDNLGQRCWGIWNNQYGLSSNKLQFYVFNSNLATSVESSTNLNDGNWHNIVCVFKPSTYLRIYADGSLDAENTTSIPPSIDNDIVDFLIGGIISSGNPLYMFQGNVDEVAVFNSDQSANISTIYNGGKPNDITSLSPLSWWRMGESANWDGSNWRLTDQGSGGNNATSQNMIEASRVTDVPPNPFTNTLSTTFDGVDDYVDMSNPSNLNSVTTMSISCWFKTTVATGVLVGADDQSLGRRFILLLSSSKARFLYFNASQSYYFSDGTTSVNDGNWHNVISVLDGTSIKVYVDGVLEGTANGVGNMRANINTPINIGRRSYASSQLLFQGNIDETSIFNTALTQSEVTSIYNGGVPTNLNELSTTPLSWWRMGDGSIYPTINDEIGSNDGTMTNMSSANFVNDVPEFNTKSILLDGIDDFVDMGNDTSLQPSNFSVCLWVKPSTNNSNRALIHNGAGLWGSSNHGFFLQQSYTNYYFKIGDGTTSYTSFNGGLVANTWQFVAMTYDGVNMKTYLNGILQDTLAVPNITYGTSATWNPFYIGRTSGGSQYMSGGIDEVSLFNSELSASDITSIYNSGVPNDISSLSPVGWWRCGDGDTSPTLTDNGSGGNNGTMTNFTTFSTDVPT